MEGDLVRGSREILAVLEGLEVLGGGGLGRLGLRRAAGTGLILSMDWNDLALELDRPRGKQT